MNCSIRVKNSYDISAYPNPYNPSQGELTVDIYYRDAQNTDPLPSKGVIQIFSENGRLVKNITGVTADMNMITLKGKWDGRDEKGRDVLPGIYFFAFKYIDIQKTGGNFTLIRR